ncbi:hypothetical protein [Pedobacter sp. D749]|uniref:hypothetical protein n=1 Tax=Pedobacter sp. D749 TaxID=2856523 RepID=UPI001C565CD5|nr:hypothetical protein [Pedobacter sp. D749]QXU39896.1 hypothetical protein KYH19_12765 [Pedobacter sp. D749]
MNKSTTIFSILICVSVISCKRDQTAMTHSPISNVKYSNSDFPRKVSQLIKSDTLIDFDVNRAVTTADKPITASEYAKMRVATYRFYRHVKLIDGKYIYQGEGGSKAINLSERVFSAFTNNLNEINKAVSNEQLAKGKTELQLTKDEKRELPEVTDEYLNSLLK